MLRDKLWFLATEQGRLEWRKQPAHSSLAGVAALSFAAAKSGKENRPALQR
jgi:hypothetical protein